MARCVRILGSKGWTEGVAIRETNSESLNIELTTDTKESWLTKHVFLVIDELILERHWCEVEEMVIVGCSLLLFLVLLWFLSFGSVFSGLSFISSFLLFFLLFDLLGSLWGLQLVLQFGL